jgi:hypothetical protein
MCSFFLIGMAQNRPWMAYFIDKEPYKAKEEGFFIKTGVKYAE